MSFEAGWALDNTPLGDLGMSEQQWFDFESGVLEQSPHRILACPYAPQESPLIAAAYSSERKNDITFDAETEATNWLLLLQLDTGVNGFFAGIHDVGWLYFLIRRDYLAKHDFSQVWFDGQCT